MIETDFMKLYEELSALQEVKEIKSFNDGSDEKFYHFYEDLSDLINSLKIRRIYSNKNAQASQLDIYYPDASYVCMTVGKEGKQRTAQIFGTRPFGIAFKDLKELCDRTKNYTFDPEPSGAYSQFLAKTQYNTDSAGRPTQTVPTRKLTPKEVDFNKLIKVFRDFELLAIGELSDGEYFISGGQGRNLTNHWHSKTFTNENIYKTLKAWFLTNMGPTNIPAEDNTAQYHMYYHFKNNTIGNPRVDHPEDIWGKHVLNTDAQLNKNYIPRPDGAAEDKASKFNQAMDFGSFKCESNITFKEIIGVGPFQVTDDAGHVLIKMDICTPGNKGGYNPPKVFSALAGATENAYTDIDDYSSGARESDLDILPGHTSRPQHLMLTQETANFIADLYNESEHRVYIHDKKDLVFKPADLEVIILPTTIKAQGKNVYNLYKLVQAVSYGALEDYTDKTSFRAALINAAVIPPEVTEISDLVYKNLILLINLITQEYDHIIIEFIDTETAAVSTLSLNTNYANISSTDHLQNKKGHYVNDHAKLRYIPEDDIVNFNILTQMENIQEVEWDGVTSVVAEITSLGGKARLGAETILIGKGPDPENEGKEIKYVLFVDNAHKAKGFFELPGGGLHDTTVNAAAFKNIALHRLHFKGGIESEYISNLTDTGKGLLLVEKGSDGSKGAAKDSKVTWPWSYYKLFTAYYTKPIDPNDADYFFDNRHLLSTAAKGEKGYTCYLKWIPVDSLDYNRSVLTRYSNIFEEIRNLAANY